MPFGKPLRHDRSSQLQLWIDRLAEGDGSARDALIEVACERLRVLSRQMLTGDRMRRFEQTDDVLQEALVELHKSLKTARPATVREFLSLAAFHIRRTLARMARHYFGPLGEGTHRAEQVHSSPWSRKNGDVSAVDSSTASRIVGRAERWLCVQRAVAELPEALREVTELVWFHGLTQRDAAEVLQISYSTLRRRWLRARLALFEHLKSHQSGLSAADLEEMSHHGGRIAS